MFERIAVIGGGIVGLSVAWHLQASGADVTVIEKQSPGAGASRGNAGWISPDLVEPLPSPAALRHGVFDLVARDSPVAVADVRPETLRFLGAFARHCTPRRWRLASRALQSLSKNALAAYDELTAHTSEGTTPTSILAAFTSRASSLDFVASHGHAAHRMTEVSPREAREIEPALSDHIGAAVVIEGQRYTNPHQFTTALAEAFCRLGGELRTGVTVTAIEASHTDVHLGLDDSDTATAEPYEAVVVAAGVDSAALVRRLGVTLPLVAGRGYSFDLTGPNTPSTPLYVPERRMACTPLSAGYRVAGVMEFGGHGRPRRDHRIDDMREALRPFLAVGEEALEPTNRWMGSRPCTPDGLPLIGATSSPRVHLATGHGMWGVTLGPITGQLVARSIRGDDEHAVSKAFSPLR